MSLNSEALRAIIEDPRYRILLDSNRWFDEENGLPIGTTTDAMFRLPSGKYQQKFVTLWNLFDHYDDFEQTVDYFAEIAQAILREKSYDTVVACTATAKYIMEHVHWRIESPDDKIRVEYLGHHPFLSLDTKLLELRDRRVLVVTDVIASGAMTEQLVEAIEQLDGKAVAVLCVVHTDSAKIKRYKETGELPSIRIRTKNKRVEINALTELPIERFNEPAPDADAPFDRSKAIKIDPVTILPVGPRTPNGRKPLIGIVETYQFFEEARAISFDFFKQDHLRFCTAIRCHQLLSGETGAKIRARIEPAIRECFNERSDTVIVTAFDADDMAFRNFVTDGMRSEIKKVVVASRELLDGPGQHFLMDPADQRVLNGHPVLLLMSQLHEAERLESLSALLAEQGATYISVLCLINRLGPDTGEFILRIRRILRGLGAISRSETDDSLAHFEFIPVMSLVDLDNGELVRLQQTLASQVEYFSGETRTQGFRRLMRQEVDRYFSYKAPTSHVFQCGRSDLLSELTVLISSVAGPKFTQLGDLAESITAKGISIQWRGEAVSASTLDGMLSLLAGYTLETHDFHPLLEQLSRHTDKRVLYRLVALLLVESNHLRMTRRFGQVRVQLMEYLERLRTIRFRFEEEVRQKHHQTADEAQIALYVQQAVNTEANLLFGLSLLSFFDNEFRSDEFIVTLITGGRSAEDWLTTPTNLLLFFSEERLAMGASMLMHFTNTKFRMQRVAEGLKKSLTAQIRSFSQTFCIETSNRRFLSLRAAAFRTGLSSPLSDDPIDAGDSEASPEDLPGDLLLQQIQSNLDFLLSDLGVHSLERRDQVIRYLYRETRLPRRRHNPIRTNLNNIRNLISRHLPSGEPPDSERRQRVSLSTVENSTLDDAIFTIALLERIAEAARSFFTFARVKLDEARYYQGLDDQEGTLAFQIREFGDRLQAIRKDETISFADKTELDSLRHAVNRRVLGEDSVLQRELNRYYVPFFAQLADAMQHENEYLTARGFGPVWARENQKIWEMPVLNSLRVIADPLELRELLRNLCRNAEHSFRGIAVDDYSVLVSVIHDVVPEKVPPPEHDQVEYLVFKMAIKGRSLPDTIPEDTTLIRHAREIESFGGSLRMSTCEDGHGAEFILKLIARRVSNENNKAASALSAHQ